MDSSSTYYQFTVESEVLDHIKNALRGAIMSDGKRMGLDRKVSSVRFVAESLQRHLERLLDLEEEVGYQELLEEIKPHLHDRATLLLKEHMEIRKTLQAIAKMTPNLKPGDEPHFVHFCENVLALLDKVDRHERSERIILQELYCSDEGGEG